MRRSMLGTFLGYLALSLATEATAGPVAAERALAIDLTGSGRDAIVLRAENGEGAVVFEPDPRGGFSLKLYTGMGSGIASIALADVDRDGRADLVLKRQDGSLGAWLADETGGFAPEPEIGAPTHHGAHAVAAPPREREDLRALTAAADVPSTAADLDRPGPQDVVAMDLAGVVPGFVPRLVVAGRFLGEGVQLAVVGAGARPRVVVLDPHSERDLVPEEIFTPTATHVVQVGQGGFLFVPATSNILPGDTVQWTWSTSFHNVVSGADCTNDNVFCSTTDANCGANPTSNAGTVYSHVFPAAGSFPYFCRPHCVSGMTGVVNVQAPASPGAVPNHGAIPGTHLTLEKTPPVSYTAKWGSSCSGAATNYALYEGTLPIAGGVYSHIAKNCTLGNVTATTFTTAVNKAYYLIVPETASNEGSYGTSSTGEIPQGGGACLPRLLAACP